MTTSVSTLQELLEAIASANDNDSIQLLDSISITSSTEVTSSVNLTIDLNSNSISISTEKGLYITGGTYTFTNGSITSAVSDGIWAEGADTSVTFGSNLAVTGIGTVVDVQKKSNLVIDGGSITSVAGDGPTVSVEGYTNANTNSAITVYNGTVDGGSNNAINVSKKGACYVHGGIISSEADAICKADDTATIVEITCGTFKGNIPEGVVDESIATISEPNENGFYTVIANDTDTDIDVDVDTDTDANSDVDSDTDTDTDTDTDANDASDVDVDSDVDADSDSDTDTVDDASADTESDPTPTMDPEPQLNPVTPSASNDTKTSAALKKTTRVYATPSIKHPIDDIIGAVRILEGEYSDPTTGITFKRIEYTLPGNGRKAVGFVISSTVTGE